jgi:hypothetical protein
MAFEPFMKWGFDFMGLVKLTSRYIKNQYIIITTNYTTKWAEMKALRDNMTKTSLNLFMKKILFSLDARPILQVTKVVILLIKLLKYLCGRIYDFTS